MEMIRKKIKLGIEKKLAFQRFIEELNNWWPKEYTWSKNDLQQIKIGREKDEFCTEIGPYGFRCDWGRVTELIKNERIDLKWQISPNREPVPNPKSASDISISFYDKGEFSTILEFSHYNFKNHGKEADEYRKLMDSENGWDYILKKYKDYCEA